jgi:hypothetical protein
MNNLSEFTCLDNGRPQQSLATDSDEQRHRKGRFHVEKRAFAFVDGS